MADPNTDHSLFVECLAAMAVSGDVYPCDLLAPSPMVACGVSQPSPVNDAINALMSQSPRN